MNKQDEFLLDFNKLLKKHDVEIDTYEFKSEISMCVHFKKDGWIDLGSCVTQKGYIKKVSKSLSPLLPIEFLKFGEEV